MIATINNVNKEVASDLNISLELVKKVNTYYWKHLSKAVSSGQHNGIRIKNIGTWVVSRTKANNHIRKIIGIIRYLRTTEKEFKKKTREECIEQQLHDLRILLQRRNELAKIYKDNRDAKVLKKSLGKQTPDTAGLGEQVVPDTRDQENGKGTLEDLFQLPL